MIATNISSENKNTSSLDDAFIITYFVAKKLALFFLGGFIWFRIVMGSHRLVGTLINKPVVHDALSARMTSISTLPFEQS
jgi:hypothetical protein